MRYKIELTDNQLGLVLRALGNESVDDAPEFGEYSYWKCYNDLAKKAIRAGFINKQLEIDGFVGGENE